MASSTAGGFTGAEPYRCTASNNTLSHPSVITAPTTLLARYYSTASVRPSVRPSVRHTSVLYRNDCMNRAVSGNGGVLPSILQQYNALQGNSDTSKKKGTSLWNFVPNSVFREFRQCKSIVLSTKLVGGRAC